MNDNASQLGTAAAAPRRRVSPDRLLLVVVLCLQLVIIGLLLRIHIAPVLAPVLGAAAESEVDRLVQSVLNTRFPGGAQAGSPAALHDDLGAALESAMENLAQLQDLADFDRGWEALAVSPSLDMRDSGDAYVVVCRLPGVQRQDACVTLDGGVLDVKATLPGPHAHRGGSGAFERRVRLPGPVHVGEGAATLTDGVLRVVMPKGTAPAGAAGPVRLL